jgi:hypothetical protein
MADVSRGQGAGGGVSGPAVRVRALAVQMRDRCLRLDELSTALTTCVVAEEPDAVVALLGEREPLVVELARLGDELSAILDDPASARQLGHDEHTQIRDRLAQLEQVMARIRERDRKARAELQRRRDELATRLVTANTAGAANRAYSGAGRPVQPIVQDSRG